MKEEYVRLLVRIYAEDIEKMKQTYATHELFEASIVQSTWRVDRSFPDGCMMISGLFPCPFCVPIPGVVDELEEYGIVWICGWSRLRLLLVRKT